MAFSAGQWPELDWVDRANSVWSVLLLSVLSAGTFLLRFWPEAFTCWTPAHFTGSYNAYTRQSAALESNFNLALGEGASLPLPHSQHLSVPLVLFLQALGFLAPAILWHLARPFLTPALQLIGAPITSAADAAHLLLASLKRDRIMLSLGYLVMKSLACLNLLIQFIIFSVFYESRLLILEAPEGILTRFPTMVMGDMDIAERGTMRKYSFQCLSPMNDIIVRLYVFLWFWLLFLGSLTLLHTVVTAASLFLPALRDRRLEMLLHGSQGAEPGQEGAGQEGAWQEGAWQEGAGPKQGAEPNSGDVSQWVAGTLGADGTLLLSRLAGCQGPLTAAKVAQEMWRLRTPPGRQPVPAEPHPQPGAPPPPGQDDVPLTVISGAEADADVGMEKVPL